jgi:hypothetical protein
MSSKWSGNGGVFMKKTTLKQQFLAKTKNKYQILDEYGKVLGEYRSQATAITMEKTLRLNKHDRLEIKKA